MLGVLWASGLLLGRNQQTLLVNLAGLRLKLALGLLWMPRFDSGFGQWFVSIASAGPPQRLF